MLTDGRRAGRLRARAGQPVDQPVPARRRCQRVAAARGRRPAAAHRELADPDARCRGGRRRRRRSASCSAWCSPAGRAPGRGRAARRRRGHGDRRRRWPPGCGEDRLGPTSAPTPRQLRRELAQPRPRPGRRGAAPRRAADPRAGRSASWRRTGSSTASRSSRASSSPATCCPTPRTPTQGLRDVRAGARRVGGRVRRSRSCSRPVLSPRTGPHAWIVALPRPGRRQPAAARRVDVTRVAVLVAAGCARPRRAGRQDRGRHDRAARHRRRLPRPRVRALRRPLQRRVRRRRRARRRSPCPTPATPRGCSSCSPSRTPGSPRCTARPPGGYPRGGSPRHDWPREQRRQGGRARGRPAAERGARQRPRAVDLGRAAAGRPPGVGQRRVHPAHRLPGGRGPRPQLPVPAGRGHRPDRRRRASGPRWTTGGRSRRSSATTGATAPRSGTRW